MLCRNLLEHYGCQFYFLYCIIVYCIISAHITCKRHSSVFLLWCRESRSKSAKKKLSIENETECFPGCVICCSLTTVHAFHRPHSNMPFDKTRWETYKYILLEVRHSPSESIIKTLILHNNVINRGWSRYFVLVGQRTNHSNRGMSGQQIDLI